MFDLVQAVLGRRVGYSPQGGGWNKRVVAATHICRGWVCSQPSVLTVLELEGNPARIKGCITWNVPPVWEELEPRLLLFPSLNWSNGVRLRGFTWEWAVWRSGVQFFFLHSYCVPMGKWRDKSKMLALPVKLGCIRKKGTVPILGVLTELY